MRSFPASASLSTNQTQLPRVKRLPRWGSNANCLHHRRLVPRRMPLPSFILFVRACYVHVANSWWKRRADAVQISYLIAFMLWPEMLRIESSGDRSWSGVSKMNVDMWKTVGRYSMEDAGRVAPEYVKNANHWWDATEQSKSWWFANWYLININLYAAHNIALLALSCR